MRKVFTTRRICGGFFGMYAVLMVYLLFLQREPAADYWEFLRTSPNLIPLHTLRGQLTAPIGWPQIQQLAGNVVMFIPLGLLPAIWKKQQKFGTFLLTVTVSVLAVELIQWITTLGFADIDDLLLNVPGACIGYGIWQILRKKTEPKPRFFVNILVGAAACAGTDHNEQRRDCNEKHVMSAAAFISDRLCR